MKKVFVAMSGGVDSSVAAALLTQRGFAVTGVFMKNWTRPIDAKGRLYCPWQEDLAAARAAARHLDIPLKIYNFELAYHDKVVEYFFREYKAGRTPNPDVMCNREIKFGEFFRKARIEGADYIATGHYIRLRRQSQHWQLLRGIDANKDQSYFLWAIKPDVLPFCLFPIGDFSKPQVRKLAKQLRLPNAERKDSQGICFIGPIQVSEFLRSELPEKPGRVRNAHGELVGTHSGAHLLTIGQRHGIGAALGQPVYVVDKDLARNEVVVDEDWPGSKLYSRAARVGDINLFGGRLPKKSQVQVRYRQQAVEAKVAKHDNTLNVVFASPVRAVTEGQSLVWYDGDRMVGGGVIESHA